MPETKWLSPGQRDAWLTFMGMTIRIPAALETQLQRDESLSFIDYMVLAMLSESPGGERRMSDLAEASNSSASHLSRVATRLEKPGYITRTMAADDRRAVVATITPAGLAKIAQAAPGHVAEVRSLVFDKLTDEQVGQLAEIGRALLGSGCTEPPSDAGCA